MSWMESIVLDRNGHEPLYIRVRDAILREIERGALRPGDRLPPTRKVAEDLGVNRGTVSAAYQALIEGGMLIGHVGRGTFVASADGEAAGSRAAPAAGEYRWRDLFAGVEPPEREELPATRTPGGEPVVAFHRNVPDPRLFPSETFRRCLSDALAEEGGPLLGYAPADGHVDFVEYLREYLAARRGLTIPREELLVVNGSQQALDLIARAFLRPGDTVLVEEPSYHGALELFRAYGARLVGVPMDGEGIRLDAAEAALARERPRLCYVMPTFQNPTGVSLGARRREALLDLTRRFAVPLVEDDFDAELYYDAPPHPPLRSLAGSQGVVYIGTPSKMLFPGLRIGWMTASAPVIRRLGRIKQIADLSGSQLLQAGFVRFARSGELERHGERVRREYAARRDALLDALGRHMPPGTAWTRPGGGMSLLVTLPRGLDADDVLRGAAGEGVLFSPGRWFFTSGGERHLRLCFGTVSVEEIERGARALGGVVRGEMESGGRTGRPSREPVLPPV